MTGEFTAEHLAKLLQHAMTITAATPDGHLTTDDFTGHQTVKVYFSRTASLYDFSRDPQLSIIRMEPGAEQVFRRIEGLHPETREPIRGGDLTKGVILKMRRGRIDSNIPVDLGFNINGVHGSVADLKGNTYAFVVPRSKSLDADKNSFYVPKNQITRELLARYNDINPEKLREGVYIVGNNPLAAIDNKCVIAAMIRLNAASLGVDVSKLPPENTEGFFGIDRRVPEACLARYDEEQNVGFHDMRNLEITMTRLDSPKDWANPAGVCDNIARRNKTDLAHADNTRLNNKYTISGEIEFELNLVGKGE